MDKRGKDTEDFNSKVVFILAVIVVLIVATSTWLVLNRLSVDASQFQPKPLIVTKVIEHAPSPGGVVGLTILPQPKENK